MHTALILLSLSSLAVAAQVFKGHAYNLAVEDGLLEVYGENITLGSFAVPLENARLFPDVLSISGEFDASYMYVYVAMDRQEEGIECVAEPDERHAIGCFREGTDGRTGVTGSQVSFFIPQTKLVLGNEFGLSIKQPANVIISAPNIDFIDTIDYQQDEGTRTFRIENSRILNLTVTGNSEVSAKLLSTDNCKVITEAVDVIVSTGGYYKFKGHVETNKNVKIECGGEEDCGNLDALPQTMSLSADGGSVYFAECVTQSLDQTSISLLCDEDELEEDVNIYIMESMEGKTYYEGIGRHHKLNGTEGSDISFVNDVVNIYLSADVDSLNFSCKSASHSVNVYVEPRLENMKSIKMKVNTFSATFLSADEFSASVDELAVSSFERGTVGIDAKDAVVGFNPLKGYHVSLGPDTKAARVEPADKSDECSIVESGGDGRTLDISCKSTGALTTAIITAATARIYMTPVHTGLESWAGGLIGIVIGIVVILVVVVVIGLWMNKRQHKPAKDEVRLLSSAEEEPGDE